MGGYSFKALLDNDNPANWQGPMGTLTAIATDVFDNNIEAQTFAYRTRDFRFITYPDGSEELYDLKSDPHEWHNLENEAAYTSLILELKNQMIETLRARQ